MATFRIPILSMVRPDATGECFPQPYSVLATNDVFPRIIWRFGSSNVAQPSARHGLYGGFVVPKNYVGSPKAIIVWTTTLTSGNVVWDFDYRAIGGDDSESLDQTAQETLTVTDAAPSAAHERLETSVTLTAANLAVDDEVEFLLARDGADAADTMAGSAMLFSLLFEYTDA